MELFARHAHSKLMGAEPAALYSYYGFAALFYRPQ